ncbi:GPI inositol deacylase, partial [Cladochytrium tenue]
MPARHRLATLVAVAGGLLVWAASLATFLTPGAGGPDRAHPSCRMSYMYPPNYVQVPGFEPNVTAAGRGVLRYSLSLYREGGGMDPDSNEQLGLPVLFIPGNAGSSHQVRSLGRALSELRPVYAPAGISLDIYA